MPIGTIGIVRITSKATIRVHVSEHHLSLKDVILLTDYNILVVKDVKNFWRVDRGVEWNKMYFGNFLYKCCHQNRGHDHRKRSFSERLKAL